MKSKDSPDPEFFARAQEIFHAVSELPLAQRSAALAAECDGDAKMQSYVQHLLDGLDSDFLESGLIDFKDDASLEGCEWKEDDLVADRFRIVRRIGAGGMGEVYEAYDQQLKESVALKTVRSRDSTADAMWRRLTLEVSRARKVIHPNVCRTYEFFGPFPEGVPGFLTMQLLKGQDLAGYLRANGAVPRELALEWLDQIAQGLEACHLANIIHGDLKPSNVFLCDGPGGKLHAVLTDFGLARPNRAPGAAVSVTLDRQIAGTPAYMAPEQLEGHNVTPAADTFALGLLACEMTTGKRLWSAVSRQNLNLQGAAALRSRLATKIPADWAKVIERCLQVDASKRFETPGEFVAALRGAPAAAMRRRVVIGALAASTLGGLGWWIPRSGLMSRAVTRVLVLPVDRSGTGVDDYRADGLTMELIQQLQNRNDLRVPGFDAVKQWKGRAVQVAEAARLYEASAVVQGTLSMLGGAGTLVVHVLDASGKLLRNRKYALGAEQQAGSKLAKHVGDEIADDLGARDSVPGQIPGTADARAHDLLLQANYRFARRNPEDVNEAIALFRSSFASDPFYAAAYTGLADALCSLADVGALPEAGKAFAEAKAAALRAIELAPEFGHAYASRGLAMSLGEWRFADSLADFAKALQLSPADVVARQWLSAVYFKLGRFDDCLREANDAYLRDPMALPTRLNRANMHLNCRRYAEAARMLAELQDLAPEFWVLHDLMAETQARLGNAEAARKEMAMSFELGRTPARSLSWAANTCAILGDRAAAEQHIAGLTDAGKKHQFQPFHVARAYAQLGLPEQAVVWLEKGLAVQDSGLQSVAAHASFDPIRNHPALLAFLAKLPHHKV